MNCRKAVCVLNRFQVAVDDKFSVRAPHLPVKIPRGGGISRQWIIVWIGPALVEKGKISIAPGQFRIILGIAILFPVLALAKESTALQSIEFLAFSRRHALLFPRHIV